MHGHRVAAAWLEAEDETESLVLVQLDERGGDLDRSARWFVQAIDRASKAATTSVKPTDSACRSGKLALVRLVRAQALHATRIDEMADEVCHQVENTDLDVQELFLHIREHALTLEIEQQGRQI